MLAVVCINSWKKSATPLLSVLTVERRSVGGLQMSGPHMAWAGWKCWPVNLRFRPARTRARWSASEVATGQLHILFYFCRFCSKSYKFFLKRLHRNISDLIQSTLGYFSMDWTTTGRKASLIAWYTQCTMIGSLVGAHRHLQCRLRPAVTIIC